ncbi:MAG: histidine phosphatase family protein [Ktedonobacteraceae bacterium]
MSLNPEISLLLASDTDPFLRLENGGTELYLIRHADALPGADEVVQGGYDDQSLSELGRRQSQALAERLRGIAIVAIYSSPTKRSRQTATYVGDALGLKVCIDENLREVGLRPNPHLLAQLEANERAIAVRAYLRDIEEVALRIGIWSHIPGCESSIELRTRLTRVVDQIASQHRGERVMIVTHAGAINAYIAAVLGLERDFFFPASNASISVLRVKGQRHLLISLNDVAHLQRDSVDR